MARDALRTAAASDITILKNSEQYLVYRYLDVDGFRVCKIAHKNGDKLDREVDRIVDLKAAYAGLAARLPAILDHGTFASGIHEGKRYYVQEFLPGSTLSSHVQEPRMNFDSLQPAFGTIVSRLLDIVAEHRTVADADIGEGEFLKARILEEHSRVRALKNVSYVANVRAPAVNGVSYPTLAHSLDHVFRSAMFRDLNMEPAFISDLGHWNFHGDNIILKDLGKPYAFRVIDPDINLERCDPLFGIARLFYSFPHDTADYHQYVIQAPIFASSEADRVDFLVDFLWPRLVYEKYARLFSCVYELDDGQLRSIDDRLSLSALMFRLKLNYLYCVMRGVNANYDERIEFVDRNITEFRNKAIFLYLQALVFAAHLKEFVDADHS